jgi:outer membrane receptor protein involved in Fe transport
VRPSTPFRGPTFEQKSLRRQALGSALIACTAGIGASAADAQDPIERVVVTGSRLPQRGLTSLSPVVTIGRDEADAQGTTSVDTLLNSMPQVFPILGPEVNEGSMGTGLVDLRRLGPYRTLVLINGRRMPMGFSDFPPHADLNMIPIAAVERVELLTGGASAVYGADALAGVVNFITRDYFDGVEVNTQYSVFNHVNDDALSRRRIAFKAAIKPEEFPIPPKQLTDGPVVSLSGIMGATLPNDRGGIMLFAEFRHAEPVLQSARDFAACNLASNFTGETGGGYFGGLSCKGSLNSALGRFRSIDRLAGDPLGGAFKATAEGSFVAFDEEADSFNQGPTHFLHRPDERILIGALGRYRLSDSVEAYAEVAVGDDRNTLQRGKAGLFRTVAGTADGFYRVNCDNPFLLAGTPGDRPFDILCGVGTGLGPTNDATVDIGRRFTAMPARQDEFQYTSYRSVLGATLERERWTFDVYAQLGDTSTRVSLLNNTSLSRINRALQVVDTDPGPAVTPVCKSLLDGSDPDCVPANIFQLGELTAEAIDYLSISGRRDGRVRQTIVSGAAVGDLDNFVRFASSPIDVAVGAEYRQEELESLPDAVILSGDIPFFEGDSVSGRYEVAEVFGEIGIPLLEDARLAQLVELVGGYRYSDYDTVGGTHTYKFGLHWAVSEDVRLRASQQHAVRAPNIVELFLPVTPGGWAGSDPCASIDGVAPPAFSEAQCLNTGLSASQYAVFSTSAEFRCPTDVCAARYGGNAALRAEESDTTTFGVVMTPRTLGGLLLTVDYYEIELRGAIGIYPAQVVLERCANTNDPTFCGLIHRAPGTGALFGAGQIDLLNTNVGKLTTSGLDFDATYKLEFGVLDAPEQSLTLNFVGTKQLRHEQEPAPGTTYDCTGFFGIVCGAPWFDWRHKFRATWDAPEGLRVSLAWRHFSEVALDANTENPVFNSVCDGPCGDLTEPRIRAYDYLDAYLELELSDGLLLHGGVNNLTDEDPPVLDPGIAVSPTNTYAGIYDLLGREIFVGVTLRR